MLVTHRLRLALVAGAAATGALAASVGPVLAAPGFQPPPGCTGSWNTAQAALHNHAPGTSPGCANAIHRGKK